MFSEPAARLSARFHGRSQERYELRSTPHRPDPFNERSPLPCRHRRDGTSCFGLQDVKHETPAPTNHLRSHVFTVGYDDPSPDPMQSLEQSDADSDSFPFANALSESTIPETPRSQFLPGNEGSSCSTIGTDGCVHTDPGPRMFRNGDDCSSLTDVEQAPTVYGTMESSFTSRRHDELLPRSGSSEDDQCVVSQAVIPCQVPHHDAFWASLYKIAVFAMFAASILIWFHTTTPSRDDTISEGIYSALDSSVYSLLWTMLFAVVFAMLWLAILRQSARVLMFGILIATPVSLLALSVYVLVNSYKGVRSGNSLQDRMMRWLSLVPASTACLWLYIVYKGRRSLAKATAIVAFAVRIVTASPALVWLGFSTLTVVLSFTYIWLSMFTRVFLEGLYSEDRTFIIGHDTWWLASFFAIVCIWTLGVLAGVQRATAAATVSQWYFYRFSNPTLSSVTIVRASWFHAVGPMLGPICLSTGLALLVRLPLTLLFRCPRSLIKLCVLSKVPISLATLMDPITLTHAAIYSQPLSFSAQDLNQRNFVPKILPMFNPSPPTVVASLQSGAVSFRLAKLLLHGARIIMSLGFGFVVWVHKLHEKRPPGDSFGGSSYAHIVALIAGMIGWSTLSAIEGLIWSVADASLICWAYETVSAYETSHRLEADDVFAKDGS